ncbi:unnamed protein product [Nippostrongylus brasiliensis]|uniref:HEAT repeat-containing protein 1 n=1 Tax=Nippostrongylus brasiliensis TaxID=27835 RepID=A0A158QZM7_NIPBR|nr:unnamed protein product [Nippostrongylus brasiliensis]
MTSLSSQLQTLRTATAQQQTVERRHVSLLFSKKDAEGLDRETAHKIGCTGLQKLKQIDPEFDTGNDLFDESRLHFQRSMITKEENAVLNEKIGKLLFKLSPYLQHFACQQIYAYNAEELILAFLPFHETNIFGRLLSIIEYNFSTSKDWGFLEEFAKKEYPIPFSALVGEEFLEKKFHMLFTFYAKLLIAVLEDSKKIDDMLLAKIMPLIAIGIRSSLPSFRQASLMVICQLAISVKLTSDVVTSLAKVVLMKLRKSSLESSLSTLTVLCQQQVVPSLSNKAVLKTLRSELNVWSTLKRLAVQTNLTPILKPLWTTLFTIANEEAYEADHEECLKALRDTFKHKQMQKRNGFADAPTLCVKVFLNQCQKKSALERAEEMATTSEFARRQEFAGDPMKKAREWIKKEKWDKVGVAWAFDEMGSRKSYFADKLDEDVETFVLEVIDLVLTNANCPVAKLTSRFVLALLSRHEESGPSPKKAKTSKTSEMFDKVLKNQTAEQYEKRLMFVLEMLANRSNPVVDSQIFHELFKILKESCEGKDSLVMRVVSLLLKMLQSPGKYKVTPADLKMEFVVEMMRATHNHHILRHSLRLLTAAVRLSPSTVTSHVMSVFTFMGSGLFRKDNELTLGIIENTSSRKVTLLLFVFFSFCARWQRSVADASKRTAEQEAFDDFTLELCSDLDPVHQVLEFQALDQAVFDRSKYSLPKLRHFRFVVMGLVVRVLSSRKLFERLGELDDDVLYRAMLPIGKKLMTSSVELDEFIASERALADEADDQPTIRYWVALSGRAETVSEKLRHLMPGGVAAKIITDILEDEKTDWRMREKVLQLANSKLIHDGFFFTEGGINVEHLERMAIVLNKWIVKVRSSPEEIVLCQNAAFSLKLVAKRLGANSNISALSDTMAKCVDIASDYQTLDENLVGNILLLSGELIRTQSMKATMVSAVPLLQSCLSILAEFSSGEKISPTSDAQTEDIQNKRQRMRQQSLSGKKHGGSALLISALTCVQRIMDQFAPFFARYLPETLVQYCRLSGRFCDANEEATTNIQTVDKSQAVQNPKSSIKHRLSLIRAALLKVEARVIPEHFAKAVVLLNKEEKPLIALFDLLGSYFDQKNRVAITHNRDALLVNVFLKGLEFRGCERNVENFASIENLERSVFKSLIAMAEVLTENTLRSVINGLIDWAEEGLKPSATKEERVRLLVVFSFANSFYDSFNTLALPYFGRLVQMNSKILHSCNATVITDPALLLLHGKKDTIDGLEADALVVHVLDFVSNCARHREFFTQDRAEALVEPLLNEVVNSKLAGHEKRCVPHLSNAIYRIADTHPDVFQEILDKLLLKTRSGRAKIRYRALLILEAIVDKVGDGVAPHLPTIMPFLSELLEGVFIFIFAVLNIHLYYLFCLLFCFTLLSPLLDFLLPLSAL